jgi:hypothetical protein
MERIGDDVDRQLRRFDGSGAMPRIVEVWPTVVGDEVVRNAWPARVARDGTLHVHTSSSVWAFELGQLASRILERLAAELGGLAPRSLRFAQGHLPESPSPVSHDVARPPLEPSAQARTEAAVLTAGIGDPELRATVRRAASLSLTRGSDGRLI